MFDKKIIERILNGVKVSDDHIMLGEPIELNKYGHKFLIRQINWYYKWESFSIYIGVFLNYFMNVCENFKIPTTLEDIRTFRDSFRLLISNKIYGQKAFKNIIKIAGLYKHDIVFMKKNFDIDDWCEYFLWVYIYNIFGVKKNLKNVLGLISKVQLS